MEWSSRMQSMMKQTEANLNPGATFSSTGRAAAGGGRPATIFHVDRHNDIPLQQQVYDLENRLRLCLNELSDVRVSVEKNGQESAMRHLTKVKEELHREVSLLDKHSADEVRLLGSDLRSRIADTEQLVKEDRRKREELIKRMKTRDYEYGELYEQQRETGLKLVTKIEILEGDVRNRKKEIAHADNDRFEDMRNEVRYQGERMEETKRQIGLRMDKIADSVRLEVMGMSDMVKTLVRECWNDHIQAVYTKVNEGIGAFSESVTSQGDRIRELELSCRSTELHSEAETSKIYDELRKQKASFSSYERENIRHFETLETQKALIKALRQTPDDISSLQIDIKRIFEMIPTLEATTRRHATTLEIIKDVPQIVEEIKWETKKLHDPVARQEELCQDVLKRMKVSEELSTASAETAAGLKAIIKTDQDTLNKNTKRILNALTKISELEEEDGRKTGSIEKVSHQLREHQNSLRGLTPSVSDLKCQIDANKLNMDPRLANTESQLSELWNQIRELQLRVNSVHVAQRAANTTAMSALETPTAIMRHNNTSHTSPIDLHVSQLSDISKSMDDDSRRQEADSKLFNIRKEHQELELLRQKNEQEQRKQREEELQLLKEREMDFQQKMEEERLAVERQREESDKIEMRRKELEELKLQHQREVEDRLQVEQEQEQQNQREQEMLQQQQQQLQQQQQQLRQQEEVERLEQEKVRQLREQEEAESSAREEVAQERRRSVSEEVQELERISSEKRISEETEKQRQQELLAFEQQKEADERAREQREKKPQMGDFKEKISVEDFDPIKSVEEPHLKAKMQHLLDNLGKGNEEFEKLSSKSEDSKITFSTGTSSKTLSKSKKSKRSSLASSDFRLDVMIPGIGTGGGTGRLNKRPMSILPASPAQAVPAKKPPSVVQTSESELERPTMKGHAMRVSSSEGEAPRAVSPARSSGGGSRVCYLLLL